ncbi:UDP-N-acetylmuramoyl-L-alanine--D-glutamate ligase [Patescibacteria group bacterium]|nr:UDP-N-acetylmuramoyl-L-alanine--D-glutamate ligase [Patescibacteria group bacterium]
MEQKKVLILGFGREGQDSFLFLRKKFPGKTIGVADQLTLAKLSLAAKKLLRKDTPTRLHFGKSYLRSLKGYDIIIKSPGIAPHIIAPFLTKEQKITSQTDIFFQNCPGTIIGITGTKGKSTTASLISEVLKYGGVKTHLVGNIEMPVLQFLQKATRDDVFVYELSSFQLEYLKASPHIAVLLNLYPEHLDHHETFATYTKAKTNITRSQSKQDFLIFNIQDKNVKKIAEKSKAKKIPFSPKKPSTAKPFLIASLEPAFIIGKLFKIPKATIATTIKNFKPLEHRLEFVGTYKGIEFYNDSLATIPEATITAIHALGKNTDTLILGGFDRGLSFTILAIQIIQSSVQTVILFPTTGQKIWKSIQKASKKDVPPQHFFANNMRQAVKLCYEHTNTGKVCLLSPASSSFNMFEDYKDRGEQFKTLVKSYGAKE